MEPLKLQSTGVTLIIFLLNLEILAIMNVSMILLSLLDILSFLLLVPSMTFVSGILKQDRNFYVLKYQDLNAFAFSSLMMENQFFLDGVMEKSVPFYHNLENYFLQLMTLIIMELLQFPALKTVKRLYQVVKKER